MKLTDTKKLLDDNGFKYTETIVPSRAEFYRQKGFNPSEDAGPFVLISIPNPNHQVDIQLVFSDATDNPDFNDLEFGGYWYELFDCEETYVAQELLTEIRRIINGNTHIIFLTAVKNGLRWHWDGKYDDLPDAEMNSMDAFNNTVAKIKSHKSWWRKLTGKTNIYEIFNWTSYEKIVK